jgi:hypothetical protein
MRKIQVAPIPQSQQSFLGQLCRDLQAAISYVSFYSIESPFVAQAIQKLHKDLVWVLMAINTVAFHVQFKRLYLNDCEAHGLEDLLKILEDKNSVGFEISKGLAVPELSAWLRRFISPVEKEPESAGEGNSHIRLLAGDDMVSVEVQIAQDESAAPGLEALVPAPPPSNPSDGDFLTAAELQPTVDASGISFPLQDSPMDFPRETSAPQAKTANDKANEALLSFVAEAWQFSQIQKKSIASSAESAELAQSFEKLFDRLLDRLEKSSPEMRNIYDWFKTPPGDVMDNQVALSMYPLLEVAVKNGWTSVLFDPATEGLVNECLAYWGANGKHELVEKTVGSLADSLGGDALERQLALTHLMDARPWVNNLDLAQKVLTQLNQLLANETSPSLYQSALLLAWDLVHPLLDGGREQPVLSLLSTLHFHADDDLSSFPDRSHIARHWIFERSTPELIRRFVRCAQVAGVLNHFPLLGDLAAPLLLEDFLMEPSPEQAYELQVFAEMKESIRSAVAEWLASATTEERVKSMIPAIRVCGIDAPLASVLCAWVAKGTPELKLELIRMIEEVGDAAGGFALRMALFDDSEEIAAVGARVIGKIGFLPGLPVLMKAARIRESHFEKNESFLVSVCQALGDLARVVPEKTAESSPQGQIQTFLEDIARKKPLLRGRNFNLPVRLAAIEALIKINKPGVWHFVESLMAEKNQSLQEALDKLIQEKSEKT